MLTQERLKELLSYDADTGIFTWRITLPARGGSVRVGKSAGSLDSKGKRQIKIDRTIHFAHRLAFLYMQGVFPEGPVDHINRDHTDNRWCNLRAVTASQNSRNRVMGHKKHGLPIGVFKSAYGTIYSIIRHNGKNNYLGSFPTIEEARASYLDAAKRMGVEQYLPQ